PCARRFRAVVAAETARRSATGFGGGAPDHGFPVTVVADRRGADRPGSLRADGVARAGLHVDDQHLVQARAVAFALARALLESEFAEALAVDEFADDKHPPPGINSVVAGSHRQLVVAVDAEDHDRENIARCARMRAARGDV